MRFAQKLGKSVLNREHKNEREENQVRKALALVLALLLALSVTACAPAAGSTSPAADTASASAADTTAAPVAPAFKPGNDVTFTMFVPGLDQVVTSYDYDKNDFTKKMVDETGIKLNFIACTPADAAAKLNTMLNSNDYPDLIKPLFNSDTNTMDYYAQQGIYVPLDQYVDRYPNIAKAYQQYPTLKSFDSGSDGKVYALPEVNECLHCLYSGGRMWYYDPFLKAYGKPVPSTTDELLAFLEWVRDNDVNKNGKKDEVPLTFQAGSLRNFVSCFAKSYMPFVSSGNIYGLALDNGKVVAQYKSDQFRQALLFMKKMYDEKLILPDSFTMKGDQIQELGESPDGPTIAVCADSWSDCTKKAGESQRWFKYFILPNVSVPGGTQYSGQQSYDTIFSLGMFVTNKCKNVEAAVYLYDHMLSFESTMAGYIGPKGEAWTEPDSGTISLNGKTPLYKLLVTFGTQRVNSSWDQANPMVRTADFRLGEQATDYDTIAKYLSTGDESLLPKIVNNGSFNEVNNYLYTKNGSMTHPMPDGIFIPTLHYTADENTRLADIGAQLNPYLDQTMVDFITGKRDINGEWGTYLQELDKMGCAEMVQIMQKEFDAKK